MSAANYSGEAPLALPKLNLQFLSPSDYLLRNFHLFRLEAAYEVREDIEVRYHSYYWYQLGACAAFHTTTAPRFVQRQAILQALCTVESVPSASSHLH